MRSASAGMWGVGVTRAGLPRVRVAVNLERECLGSPGWAAFEARLLAIPFQHMKVRGLPRVPPGSRFRVGGCTWAQSGAGPSPVILV